MTYATLQFQIDHKCAFIKDHIPRETEEIILIGHSIGSYISLHAAQRLNNDSRLSHVIGLFPTIERMAATSHGRLVTPLVTYGCWAMFPVVAAFSYLPEWMKRVVFRLLSIDTSVPHLYAGAQHLARLPVFRNFALMAKDEMEQVTSFPSNSNHTRITRGSYEDKISIGIFFSKKNQSINQSIERKYTKNKFFKNFSKIFQFLFPTVSVAR